MRMLFLYTAVIFGCSGTENATLNIPLEVSVVDDEGNPLAGLHVDVDANSSASTDDSGRAVFEMWIEQAEPKKSIISVHCPKDWSLEDEESRSVDIVAMWTLEKRIAPVTATFVCKPPFKSHVLIVRADGKPGIPVMIDGSQATVTDEYGIAQSVLEGKIGDEVRVTLDTSAQPDLRPSAPSRRLRLPFKSRFLVFDQQFEIKELVKRSHKGRRNKGPKRL